MEFPIRQPFDIETGTWALALATIRANLAACLLVTVLLTVAHLVQYWGYGGAVLPPIRAVLLGLTGYLCHRTLVSDGALTGLGAVTEAGLRRAIRFIGLYLMILLPMLVLGLCLTIPELRTLVPRGWFISFMMLMVVLYGVALVLLGTALPEIAASGRVRLAAALARGRQAYRANARAMIWGPWLFGAAHAAGMLTASWAGVPAVVTEPAAGPLVLWLVVRLADSGGHVLAAALTASVLASAWRRSRAD